MRTKLNLQYGTRKDQLLDIYYPEKETYDLLIWIHGGGLESGTRKSLEFQHDLTASGLAVVSVEYRLYPDAVFPEYIQDCAKAVKYVLDNVANEQNVKRVFLSGQSAGAYITMMLALDKHYFNEAGVKYEQIAGFISDSAQMTTHFNVLREFGVDVRLERIDEAAPLYHLSEDSFEGEMLLIYYSDDIPCRAEQNQLFYKSICRLCPEQNIQIVELPGTHCHGSCLRNANGTFDYNEVLLRFIKGI